MVGDGVDWMPESEPVVNADTLGTSKQVPVVEAEGGHETQPKLVLDRGEGTYSRTPPLPL